MAHPNVMIAEKEVLELFNRSRNNISYLKEFNIKILEYFVQKLEDILTKFNDSGHEKRIERLRTFYLDFEKELTPKDTEPENFLDEKIMNLFLYLSNELSNNELKRLLKKAKNLLKRHLSAC